MDIHVGLRSAVLDAVSGGVIVLDANGAVLVWNRWIAEFSGIPEDLAIGRPLFAIFPEIAANRLGTAITQALSHRLAGLVSPSLHTPLLPLFRCKSERQQNCRLSQMIHVSPIHMAGMPACALHIQDVTTAVLRERRLREQSAELAARNEKLQLQLEEIQTLQREIAAMHARDPLTGVLDRRHIEEICAVELARAEENDSPLVLVIVDVDRLKDINENHDHASGDAALQAAATLLREVLPPAAGVGRLAHDEFLVVVPGVPIERVRTWAEEVRQRFAALRIDGGAGVVSATLSAGLSAFPQHGRTYEELMQSLNLALFLTRHEGYNRVIAFGDNLAEVF